MDRIRFLFGLGILSVFLLSMAGCSGSRPFVSRSQFVEFTPEQQQKIDSISSTEYRLQEGDVLNLAFSYLDDLDQEGVVVLPDGSVTLLGVDRIEIAGLTIGEADRRVTEAYAQEYRDPQLSLIIRKTEGRRVYVLGQVNDPGLHQVPQGGLDILGAISVAGGFTDDAKRNNAILARVTPNGYLVQEINLDDFHQVTSSNLALIELQSYDVVYVPRTAIGDFGYFAKTVFGGLMNVTRVAADVKYLGNGNNGRLF